jgi:hypothetical protein
MEILVEIRTVGGSNGKENNDDPWILALGAKEWFPLCVAPSKEENDEPCDNAQNIVLFPKTTIRPRVKAWRVHAQFCEFASMCGN